MTISTVWRRATERVWTGVRGVMPVSFDLAEEFGGAPLHGAPVDQAEAARLAPQEDVLGDRAVLQQGELLVDDADSGRLRLGGVGEGAGGAVEGEPPAVRNVLPGEDLHQGRLAGAVLPHQGVHLARPQVEIDVVEDAHPQETLGHALHRQHRDWLLGQRSAEQSPPGPLTCQGTK